jgi:DNA-directed RNA polymerase subunit N (RpoN/RPB10)
MIYSSCPTCGFFIGNVVEDYEKQKISICNNNKLNEKQQAEEIKKVINKLGLKRYCCKMRVLTCKDMVEEIQPTKK